MSAATRDASARGAAGGSAARAVDVLVAEIGSTTTVVSAFDGLNDQSTATGASPPLPSPTAMPPSA